MKLSQFDELRLRAQELTGGKEYPDNAVVEGLFNRTELLIQRIPDVQLKDHLVRMFNEIKHRNRPYNNTQKLLALENFCDTVINGVDAERLMQNPTHFFNLNDAIMKAKKTRVILAPFVIMKVIPLASIFPSLRVVPRNLNRIKTSVQFGKFWNIHCLNGLAVS